MFSSQQTLNLVLNNLEIDAAMFKLSQEFSNLFQRFMTFSVNHESFARVFSQSIRKARKSQNTFEKMQQYE